MKLFLLQKTVNDRPETLYVGLKQDDADQVLKTDYKDDKDVYLTVLDLMDHNVSDDNIFRNIKTSIPTYLMEIEIKDRQSNFDGDFSYSLKELIEEGGFNNIHLTTKDGKEYEGWEIDMFPAELLDKQFRTNYFEEDGDGYIIIYISEDEKNTTE